MALNARESTIAWVMGGVVALGVGYYIFNSFFYTPLQRIETDITKAQKQVRDGNDILKANANVKKELADLQLQNDTAAAAAQVMEMVYSLAQSTRSRSQPNSGFTITNYVAAKNSRPLAVGKTDFEEVKFTATGMGTTLAVANFLLKLETAKIPMKVEDVTLNSRQEGTDSLNAEIVISALVYAPKATTKPGSGRGTSIARGATTRGATTRGGGTVAASAPAQKTLDEIVAELKARRERDLAGVPESTTAAATAAATEPKKTPEELAAEMKARRDKELAGATNTAPASTTRPQ